MLKVERIVTSASVECRVGYESDDQSRRKLARNNFLERRVSKILRNGERFADGSFYLILGRAVL